jgi:hypothetical protein
MPGQRCLALNGGSTVRSLPDRSSLYANRYDAIVIGGGHNGWRTRSPTLRRCSSAPIDAMTTTVIALPFLDPKKDVPKG